MAEKRMFSKKIIDTDWFMDMPASTQNLYFHLSMRADDDGFVSSPKRIIKLIGATDDDYKVLIAKKFVIPFESGVCVITDWRINNYLRTDRYNETIYKEEKDMLFLDDKGKYNLGIPLVDPVLSKSNSNLISNTNNEKEIKEKDIKHKYGEYKNVLLSDKEMESLKKEFDNYEDLIVYLDEYIEMKGYRAKSHYLAIRKWVIEAVEREHRGNLNKDNQAQKKEQKPRFASPIVE